MGLFWHGSDVDIFELFFVSFEWIPEKLKI